MTETKPSIGGSAEVWITGIGLATSLGEGLDANWDALSQRRINVDEKSFAPYIVHPWVPVNLDAQIPKKGDQRQMEAWQRIGTYAAGLALDSAGIKGNKEILARMDMIVAAGGGERDLGVDTAILKAACQWQFRARLSQRTADERFAADAVSRPALEPARRQYRHRPRRHRIVAHLHGRGSRRRRRGPDRARAHRRRPERHRAGRRLAKRRAQRPAGALRVRRFQPEGQLCPGLGAERAARLCARLGRRLSGDRIRERMPKHAAPSPMRA